MKIFHPFFIFVIIFYSCNAGDNDDISNTSKTAKQYFLKGEELYYKQNYHTAFENFNNAYNGYLISKENQEAAKSLIFLSIIQTINGDYFGSEESISNALKLTNINDAKNNDLLVSAYNQIALNKEYQKDFNSAAKWYLFASKKTNDSNFYLILKNNEAVSLYESGKYKQAIKILERLKKEKIFEDKKLEVRINDNIAFSKFLQNPNYKAETELKKALKIRELENDLWGQNASHSHLSDYFFEKDKEKSLLHAKKMLDIATEINSPDDRLEAMQKLILLETPENSKRHFITYQKLNDSLQTARSKAKNQFALIRYDTEKERADNAKKQNQILKQNATIIALVLSLILGTIAYLKRQKRLQKEKELEVKNTQLKYSKKVHDVVSNRLYRIMTVVENNTHLTKDELLDDLEDVYEKSRDISYDEISESSFKNNSLELLNTYSSDQVKVIITNPDAIDWENLPQKVKNETELVLQELMTNMKKHSKASLVNIKFEKKEQKILIFYSDNGIGLPQESFVKKNGLRNVENRIFSLGGTIIFDKNSEKGTKINISIPL